jgi:hypothetical protein
MNFIKGKLEKIDKSKLPVYEIVVDDNDDTGIQLISLVDEPAIAMKGMMFNQEQSVMSFKEVGDKQIIVGPALIPNMKIYREDEKFGQYYVVFTKETIEKMVEKFNKYGSNRKINIDHSNQMVNAFIMEDWIVENEVYDKSRMYGFEVPVGTYMIMVKVEDTDFWLEEVKGNSKFGFSIEGLLGQQLVSLSKQEEVLTIDDLDLDDLLNIFELGEYEKGVPHYTADGKLYTGPTHKDASGRLMTGATHGEDSEYLYHEDELLNKLKLKTWTNTANSSNVDNMKWNDETKELVIKFNDGSYYTYFDIDSNTFFSIVNGEASCITEGENENGSWWVGKTPSVGASVYEYLVSNGVRYESGGSLK